MKQDVEALRQAECLAPVTSVAGYTGLLISRLQEGQVLSGPLWSRQPLGTAFLDVLRLSGPAEMQSPAGHRAGVSIKRKLVFLPGAGGV